MKTRGPRLFLTLAGLALAAVGGIVWLVGDDKEVTGANGMELHSSAVWGEVLGYASTEADDYAEAKDLKETGENLQTAGIIFAVLGAGLFAARFAIRPEASRA